MARRFTSLIILIVLFTLLAPSLALAQSGLCPDYTTTLNPPPVGSYPYSMAFCGPDSSVTIGYSANIPCGMGALVDDGIYPILLDAHSVIVVPPTAITNQTLEINFAATLESAVPFVSPGTAIIRVEVYDSAGFRSSFVDVDGNNYTIANPASNSTTFYFGNPYCTTYSCTGGLAVVVPTGGYIRFQLIEPSPSSLSKYWISQVIVAPPGMAGGSIPFCSGAPPTITPTATNTPAPTATGTLTPTPTPTATITPTITPTPYPTAPGGTVTPWPTATPFVVSTIQAPPSATPWQIPTFPPFNPPPINPPTIPALPTFNSPSMPPAIGTPNWPTVTEPITGTFPITGPVTLTGTRAAHIEQIQGIVTSTGIIVTRWYTQTNEAIGWLDPDANTSGISTTSEIATGIATYITAPISYIRALHIYLPTLWPYLLIVFLLLLWIFVNLLIKYGLGIVAELIEAFRKLIELIPFFE